MVSRSETAGRTSGRTLDHAVRLYDLVTPVVTLGSARGIERRVIGLLRAEGGCRILDVGCATGKMTARIAEACSAGSDALVVGIDAAERMIEAARRRHADQPNLRFEAALAEELPFADASFDHVVSSMFFHHVNAPLKRRALLEMHRVLRPGGTAVVVDVDPPTTFAGRLCAWSGYVLFRQDEIRENIRGVLREAFDQSPFRQWRPIEHYSGYITTFLLRT